MYQVLTDTPFATSSLDFQIPEGSFYDSTSGIPYIVQWEEFLGCSAERKLRVADLGCAGGQNVLEWNARGHSAIGIDGSDCPLTNPAAAGFANWQSHKDICLFNADIAKPFSVLWNGSPAKFDLVTAWEVIEHIAEEDMDAFFKSVGELLAPDGIFIGSIATAGCVGHDGLTDYHVNVKDKSFWRAYLSQRFDLAPCYPLPLALRMDAVGNPMVPLDQPHSNLSFAFYARKLG